MVSNLYSVLTSRQIENFKKIIQRALSDGLLMKNIQYGKRSKNGLDTFRLKIAGKKKIGILSRVMASCQNIQPPIIENQLDSMALKSRNIPNLKQQTDGQVGELEVTASFSPFVSIPTVAVAATNVNDVGLKEDIIKLVHFKTNDESVLDSGLSDIQNCLLQVHHMKEGISDIDSSSEGMSAKFQGEEEVDKLDLNGTDSNLNLNIEREKAIIQEKLKSVEICRKRDRELECMDEINELYTNVKKTPVILWQSSESTETIYPNTFQGRLDSENNLPTGNMIIEHSIETNEK